MPRAIVAPSWLCPTSIGAQSAERRELSTLPGPRASRVLWRDQYIPPRPVEFTLRNPEQVQQWLDWGQDHLGEWAHWFAADWPVPGGGTRVHRFVGVPQYPQYLARLNGWRVVANVETRGRGELPFAPYPSILGLHFDGDYRDVAGGTMTAFGGTIATDDPKFGPGYYKNDTGAQGKIVSDVHPTMTLGPRWQVDGWFRIDSVGTSSRIFTLRSTADSGVSSGPGGDSKQMQFEVLSNPPRIGQLMFKYADSIGSEREPLQTLVRTVTLGEWMHFAAVQDADGVRVYLAGEKIGEDVGNHLYDDAPFTNQCFVLGAAQAGVDFPGGVYVNYLNGGLDDVHVIADVEYTGDSFDPPTRAFR